MRIHAFHVAGMLCFIKLQTQQSILLESWGYSDPPALPLFVCVLSFLCYSTSINLREALRLIQEVPKDLTSVAIKHKSNKMERKGNVQESGDLYFYLN